MELFAFRIRSFNHIVFIVMTSIENNPYFQGFGTYEGIEAWIYHDYHKQIWEVQLITGEWVENVEPDEIELP